MISGDLKLRSRITCIDCPIGCLIDVEYNRDEIVSIKGSGCKKGKKFVENEIKDPRRMLTTTISIDSIRFNRLPIRSSEAVPKDKVLKFIKEVKKIKVKPIIKMGDVIVKNFMDSGVDIISSVTIYK